MMTRKEIAACKTPLELRWLWDSQPENRGQPISSREYFINQVFGARKRKHG